MGVIDKFLEALVHVTNNITLIAFLAVIMLAILITVIQKEKISKYLLKIIQLTIALFALIFLVMLFIEFVRNWPQPGPTATPEAEASVAVAEETSLVHVWDQEGGGSLFTRYLSSGYSISIAPNGKWIAITDQLGIHIYAIGLCGG